MAGLPIGAPYRSWSKAGQAHPTRDPNSGTYQPTYGYSDGNFSSTLAKMLYLVGLGLSDETDITVKGLDVVKRASRVYLEAYTSILLVDQAVLVR